jgi:GPH family glycoside/pentoside/hexuronide:cation symporter
MHRRMGAGTAFIVAYSAAHGAKSLIWHASELLFAFFLTEAIGLPPSYVGLMLALSLLANAAMDLALGWLIRRRVDNAAAAAQVQAMGAVACGFALLLFASIGSLPDAMRMPFALMSILAFRCAYSLIDVPQNAMLAFATGDDAGRARVASKRYIVGGAAQLMLGALFAPMMIGARASDQSVRFWWLCLVLAGLVIVTSMALRQVVRHNPDIQIVGHSRKALAPVGFKRDIGHVALVLFSIAFSLSATMPIFSRLKPYFAAFAVQDVFNAGVVLSAAAVGSLLGQFGWSRLAQALPLLVVLRAALLTTVCGVTVFYGATRLFLPAAALGICIYGIGTGGVLMSVWSLLARAASVAGSPFPGTAAFGLYTCCSKVGHAVSAGLAGAILAGINYRDQVIAAGPLVVWMMAAPLVGVTMVAILSAWLVGPGSPAKPPRQHSSPSTV